MKYNSDKTVNAMLYILKKMGRSDFTKIFKILYFADRQHLATYGRMITGNTYIRMDYGPVPSELRDSTQAVKFGNSREESGGVLFQDMFKVTHGYLVDPILEPDMEYLSDTDVEELDRSIETYKDYSFSEISEVSHDSAWLKAGKNRPMDLIDIAVAGNASSELIEYIQHLNEAESAL